MKWILAVASALGIACAVPAGAATLVTNGSSQLTGVNGLVVGGSTYNVTFTDGTCAGLFGGCDAVTDFTFQNSADAGTAAAALLAAIVGSSFDTAPGTTFGCIGGETCTMLIPYGFNAANPLNFDASAPLNASGVNAVNTLNASTTTFDTGTSLTRVWALFSPATGAVPEPSSWAMMLLGFGAIGAAMRRRRKVAIA